MKLITTQQPSNYTHKIVLGNCTLIYFQDLFSPHTISSIRETTLAANDWSPDAESSWKTDSVFTIPLLWRSSNSIDTKITLAPLQIRTFIIELNE